jgi:ElaB/YqjD/DUF883 family membrane-anchored ribosome-binding protein
LHWAQIDNCVEPISRYSIRRTNPGGFRGQLTRRITVTKPIALAIAAIVVLAVSGCQPTVDEAKADFCQDLGDFGAAVVTLRHIDETSTREEVQTAIDGAHDALGELQSSAETLSGVQTDEIQSAVEELQDYVQDIPDETTLGDAAVGVRAATVDTLAATLETAVTDCTYP